jgi:hypothetical protein
MTETMKTRPTPVEAEEATPAVLADERLGRMLEEPKAEEAERPAVRRDPHGWD